MVGEGGGAQLSTRAPVLLGALVGDQRQGVSATQSPGLKGARARQGRGRGARAAPHFRHGSLLQLKTKMFAASGVANDWPGTGANACILPGIIRVGPGRSIDSSGAGMLPAVCCKHRSTLMLTPSCAADQVHDESPLRSDPP